MRRTPKKIHLTVRRASASARYRLWVEEDGDFGVALARSGTLAGLRRNAMRQIRAQWEQGQRGGSSGRRGSRPFPRIVWHRSTRRYARAAGRDLAEVRRRRREATRRVRRIERRLRRAGAYAKEARFIAHGQVFVEFDLDAFERGQPLRPAPWNP